MISKTAAPGGRNWALARLEVCTEMKTPVPDITCSCSWKEVLVLNSTTRTCRIVLAGVWGLTTHGACVGCFGSERCLLRLTAAACLGLTGQLMYCHIASCDCQCRSFTSIPLSPERLSASLQSGDNSTQRHNNRSKVESRTNSRGQGENHLSKFSQHAHKLVLVDDSSVGAFALEGDHSWHRPAGLRSWQVCKRTHTHM